MTVVTPHTSKILLKDHPQPNQSYHREAVERNTTWFQKGKGNKGWDIYILR